MEFLTILIVLGLVQWWGSGAPLQRDAWFYDWSQTVTGWFTAGRWRLLVIVALPLVLLLLVQDLLCGVLFGLLSLLLSVFILLYCLGRGDFNASIQDYLSTWVDGNYESAYERALQIGDFKQSEAIANYHSLHDHVRRALVYDGYQRWFAVVFWFLLLGPCGALGYRLSFLTARNEQLAESERQFALRFVHYLDWVPARLLSLAFFLIGNFVSGTDRSGPKMLDNMPIDELLDSCALSATADDHAGQKPPADEEHFIEYGRREIRAVQSLISRSLVCWVCVIAILALVGA